MIQALSVDGNPSFATIMKVAKALGLKLHFESVACGESSSGRSQSSPSTTSHPTTSAIEAIVAVTRCHRTWIQSTTTRWR